MKYHNIPSIDLLAAYKSGKLTGDKLISVERAISLNPMVAGVAEGLEVDDISAIKGVSSRIQNDFIASKLSQRGFWSKYAGWIGLSSIVILLCLYGVNKVNSPEPRYSNEIMLISDSEVDPDAKVVLETKDKSVQDKQVIKDDDVETGDQITVANNQNDTVIAEQLLVDDQTQFTSEENVADNSTLMENKDTQKETFDNTREFSAENKKNQTIMLAVSNVQILSKSNPDALNTRSTGGKGNPLGEQTTSTSNNFSVSDIPSYPGGDRALNNYFKGKLRPIQIPQHQDKFDRTVLIELTINSRGKLKDYKIRGQLHPTHQDALVKAIEELPRFNKGSEKITYSLGLSF